MKKAVFIDRDGVINKLIFNPQTSAYESPLSMDDLRIAPEVFDDLKHLKESGYLLFIVSNQPNFAKGKSTLESLHQINQVLLKQMYDHGVILDDCYYCYHHPQGIVQGYALDCSCRKPKPYFLLEARDKYAIDMGQSWMIGDQDSDILCGQAAGVRTVLINERFSQDKRGRSKPDYLVENLAQAVKMIQHH